MFGQLSSCIFNFLQMFFIPVLSLPKQTHPTRCSQNPSFWLLCICFIWTIWHLKPLSYWDHMDTRDTPYLFFYGEYMNTDLCLALNVSVSKTLATRHIQFWYWLLNTKSGSTMKDSTVELKFPSSNPLLASLKMTSYDLTSVKVMYITHEEAVWR